MLIVNVQLQYGQKTITVSLAEAKELLESLKELFGQDRPMIPSVPPPWPIPRKLREDPLPSYPYKIGDFPLK